MALTVGSQLGSYEVTALLGKGGFGEVYHAKDKKLERVLRRMQPLRQLDFPSKKMIWILSITAKALEESDSGETGKSERT